MLRTTLSSYYAVLVAMAALLLPGCEQRVSTVSSLDIEQVLALQEQGKVVFVDAREHEEYAAGHIPGAINIPLRKAGGLSPDVVDRLAKADYIVSYCLKDFRGYEVARRLGENLDRNTFIMKPFGLNGWRKNEQPLASLLPAGSTE